MCSVMKLLGKLLGSPDDSDKKNWWFKKFRKPETKKRYRPVHRFDTGDKTILCTDYKKHDSYISLVQHSFNGWKDIGTVVEVPIDDIVTHERIGEVELTLHETRPYRYRPYFDDWRKEFDTQWKKSVWEISIGENEWKWVNER